MRIKTAQFGLGPIGIETVKLAASKPWIQIVGAIDIDVSKVGRTLAEITGERKLGNARVFSSLSELSARHKPSLVFHTTVSKFKDAFPQLEALARAGINVVSSCEELLFPQLRNPGLAAKLDRLCKAHRVRILGTGVNPGFVMDVLPLCLTGVSRNVRAVHIQRVVNASTRREPLQRKIGSGLPLAEFNRLFRAGKAGHAGLQESLALIAHALKWKVKTTGETGAAVAAKKEIRTKFLTVKKGQTCGLHQRAEATLNGRTCLTLDLKMYLDAEDPHDAIQIEGEPSLDVLVRGGVAGDQATVAALVNSGGRLLDARPGLLLMTDLSLPRIA